MKWIMVDTEADGPYPPDYSMIALGAVLVEPSLKTTFECKLRPISPKWKLSALKVSGITRDESMNFPDAKKGITAFRNWVKSIPKGKNERLMFVSDNNGFDWQFVNYYLWYFIGDNIFGHTSTNLGSLYKGLSRDTYASFKHLRRTSENLQNQYLKRKKVKDLW